jgi:hypothetical protein
MFSLSWFGKGCLEKLTPTPEGSVAQKMKTIVGQHQRVCHALDRLTASRNPEENPMAVPYQNPENTAAGAGSNTADL